MWMQRRCIYRCRHQHKTGLAFTPAHTLLSYSPLHPLVWEKWERRKCPHFGLEQFHIIRVGCFVLLCFWLLCTTAKKILWLKGSTRVVCSASSNRLLHTQFTTSALRRWPKPCSTSTSWPSLRPLLAGRPTAPQVQESSRPSCSASRWLVPAHQSASAGWRSSSCCQAWLGGKQLGASSSYCPSPPPQQTPGPDQSVCRGSMTEQTVCGWLLLFWATLCPLLFF